MTNSLENKTLIQEIVFKLKQSGRSDEEVLEDCKNMKDIFEFDEEKVKIELKRYHLVQDYKNQRKNSSLFKEKLYKNLEERTKKEIDFLLEDPKIKEISNYRDLPAINFDIYPNNYFFKLFGALFDGYKHCEECGSHITMRFVKFKRITPKGKVLNQETLEYPLFYYCKKCGTIYDSDHYYKLQRDFQKINEDFKFFSKNCN
jgi:hypothetical protein